MYTPIRSRLIRVLVRLAGWLLRLTVSLVFCASMLLGLLVMPLLVGLEWAWHSLIDAVIWLARYRRRHKSRPLRNGHATPSLIPESDWATQP